VFNCTLLVVISLILVGKSPCKSLFLVLLMEQHYRDDPTHSEENSRVDPFETPNWIESKKCDLLSLYSERRRHWSFAFTYASTSSKFILFSIRSLFQLKPFFKTHWHVVWIVSEMIDWLKVRDLAFDQRNIP